MRNEIYNIKKVDVSRIVIICAISENNNDLSKWFEEEAKAFFEEKIINQINGVEINDLIMYPVDREPVESHQTGVLTFFFEFDGSDNGFRDEEDVSAEALVTVMVNANTGEAYAVETEEV